MNCEAMTMLKTATGIDTIFMDPPDNIGLEYNEYSDKMEPGDYNRFLEDIIQTAVRVAPTVYVSFNAKHFAKVGSIATSLMNFQDLMRLDLKYETRLLIQGFTFGQNSKTDYTNNFRPIIRITQADAPRFPEQTKIESWRMRNGDKRANPEGTNPGDVWRSDFLEYSRVTGNSKQRRKYHPTQLHEGLVEDLLLMSTPPGGTVMDPFAGTGTTLRVCMENGWNCRTGDVDLDYCRKIAEEHCMQDFGGGIWYMEKTDETT